jgi:hypothetical protein
MGNESGEVMDLWRGIDEDVGEREKNEDFTSFKAEFVNNRWKLGVSVSIRQPRTATTRRYSTRMVHGSYFGFIRQENVIPSLTIQAD